MLNRKANLYGCDATSHSCPSRKALIAKDYAFKTFVDKYGAFNSFMDNSRQPDKLEGTHLDKKVEKELIEFAQCRRDI